MEQRDSRGHFTEEFRRWSVSVLEAGTKSSADVMNEYGIRGHSTLLKWCRRYGGNQYPIMSTRTRNGVTVPKEEQKLLLLRNQVKVLERELKEARLKQATLETLIDIAEHHYSISIKKNTGDKQSSK